MPLKYKYILLDADETLFDFDTSEYNAFRQTVQSFGFQFADELYDEYHLVNKSLWEDFELGHVTKPFLLIERFRRVISAHAIDADPQEFADRFREALADQCILLPGAESFCRTVAKEAELYILTNGITTTQKKRFERSPIKDCVKGLFISEQIGFPKPNKEFFDAVFAAIPGIDTESAIMIGDSLSSDIRGGKNAGIKTVWYNPHLKPNTQGVCPDFTASSYDQIIRILRGDTGRKPPHPPVPAAAHHEHTTRRALVLLPAGSSLRERLRESAPDFEFVFATPEEAAHPDCICPQRSEEELSELCRGCEVVIGAAPLDALQSSSELRFLQLTTAGTEPYAVPGKLDERITIANATGAYGTAVAEHMLASLLMLWKKLHLYRDNMKNAQWLDHGEVRSPLGSKILVVGCGDIGSRFAGMAHALGAHVIGVRRTGGAVIGCDETVTADRLDELLPEADAVVLALPSNAETKGMFSRERLSLMKRDAVLINAGRGNTVDTDALAELLADGRIAGAALDVTEPEPLPPSHPLWKAENVLITPHVSGFYHLRQTYDAVADICTENMRRYSSDGELLNIVDRKTGYARG